VSAPDPDENAREIFGVRLPLAVAYAQRLATNGVDRGLLGPRETDRIWPRHLVNSALVADLIPAGAAVVDVGSGAGLPGIPLAIRRPDVTLELVEPIMRRTEFLTAVVLELGLAEQVRVIRGRADDPQVQATIGAASWLVARAVAPLDRLVKWCLPLLAPRGTLLAIKGRSAAEEAARLQASQPAGVEKVEVRALGSGSAATMVVIVRRAAARDHRRTKGARR
jgi:16S rRNA (guanine527-N7)-methyltransferase